MSEKIFFLLLIEEFLYEKRTGPWRVSMINTNFKGSVPERCFFTYVRTFNWLPVACMPSSLNRCFVNNVTVIVFVQTAKFADSVI